MIDADKRVNKVIFLISHLSDGGAEKVLSELSCNLSDDIEQVLVLFGEKISYPYKARLISLNSPDTSLFLLKRVYKFIRRIFKLKRIINVEKPDCVISFMEEANILNIMVSRHPIVTVHNYLSKVPRTIASLIVKALIPLFYNKAHVVTVSKEMKDDLVKNYNVKNKNITVINNPLRINEINKLSGEEITESFRKDSIPTIITIGRLTKQKGQWHLIRAFSEVRRQMPCRLVILGNGELEVYLKELVKEMDLQDDVILLGWQENPYKYLANADIFVLSSLWEGFGIVLAEAMACGLPVVSTDCLCGPREILSPDNKENKIVDGIEHSGFGLLTPVCDGNIYKASDPLTPEEQSLATAMLMLLKDKGLREHYSRQGLKRSKDFNVEKIAGEYTDLFEKACVSEQ